MMHTRGPWRILPECPNVVDYDGDGWVAVGDRQNPDWEANARFIAAAPAMFDALKLAENHLNEYATTHPRGRCKVLGSVRAAIEKATGDKD